MDQEATGELQRPAGLVRALERLRPFLAIAAAVIAVDQGSKAAIRGWLSIGESWPGGVELIRLSHVENSGAAFGILQDGGPFLAVTSVVVVVLIVTYLAWTPVDGWIATLALAMILGGAMGNLIDRVARGSVTDFIDPTHYPAFNLADSSIVVGVTALVLLSVFEPRAEEPST